MLHTLRLDADGDGAADEETLTCTGERPFWVVEQNAFVSAVELRPGWHLLRAHGSGQVTVLGIESTRAPPGETFTTFNFEVEGFHTYFVGESGVWVHNTGTPCQKVFSAFRQAAKKVTGPGSLKDKRFEILKQTKLELASDAAIPDASWAESAREVSAKMLDDFANGDVVNVDFIPTVNNWNNSFFGNAARKVAKTGTEVHHIVPEKLVEMFTGSGSLPSDFSKGAVPGHALTKEIHRGLSDLMNPIIKSPAFLALSDTQKTRRIVDFYRQNDFVSEAAVAEAWFSKMQIW